MQEQIGAWNWRFLDCQNWLLKILRKPADVPIVKFEAFPAGELSWLNPDKALLSGSSVVHASSHNNSIGQQPDRSERVRSQDAVSIQEMAVRREAELVKPHSVSLHLKTIFSEDKREEVGSLRAINTFSIAYTEKELFQIILRWQKLQNWILSHKVKGRNSYLL